VNATLLILAAGMGSRYGGLKQLDPMGPSGEKILDYSVFDALRAGFNRVVFVIRRDFEKEFREAVGSHYEKITDVDYVFQELTDLPGGRIPSVERTKPWGTTHAIWTARQAVHHPFLSINADDFYGADPYRQMAAFFAGASDRPATCHAMAGFRLGNTLSEHGSVSRGVCQLSENGLLTHVEELTAITRQPDGSIVSDGRLLEPSTPVSMNFWGFTPEIFPCLEAELVSFLDQSGTEPKSECFIPNTVASLIQSNQATVQVLETSGSWFGVTYPADREMVVASICDLVKTGAYPSRLWE